MIVNSYAHHTASSGYYKEHNKLSKFKQNQVIIIEFRNLQQLNDLIQNSLTQSEKTDINAGKKLLLLNCSTEANYKFNTLKDIVNLNKDHVKVLSASPDIVSDELYIHFERLTQTTLDIVPVSPLNVLTSKLYINFNLKTRPHRLATIALLKQHNLFELGYNSLYCMQEEWDYHLSITKKHFDISDDFKLDSLPIELDKINTKSNPAHIKFSNIQKFVTNSLLSLVTETNYFNSEPRFLTEKTFKPIALKQPFILVTVPRTLEFLRSLGYKTFDGIIDESYDQEFDDKKRLNLIIKELKRISELSDNDLQLFKSKCLSIVNYNYDLFKNKKTFIH